LYDSYPNPFNSSTIISFYVPKNTFVKITLFNVVGEYVTTIFKGNVRAGTHSTCFNASKLSSGIYYYKIETKDFSQMKNFILLK